MQLNNNVESEIEDNEDENDDQVWDKIEASPISDSPRMIKTLVREEIGLSLDLINKSQFWLESPDTEVFKMFSKKYKDLIKLFEVLKLEYTDERQSPLL